MIAAMLYVYKKLYIQIFNFRGIRGSLNDVKEKKKAEKAIFVNCFYT